ncbi:MAG: hypothetical protein HZB26_13985 [Candidatus Hydrogenedentes bacterium]|nr:hypothetical protein [Candidatus Hydrogenedentota bacterium]
MTHFPDNILTALQDAIINVFWRKEDMRSMLTRSEVASLLVSGQDWSQYKYHILHPILTTLNSSPSGLGSLRRILQETLAYKDGNHLLVFNDGQKRKREAERCLEHLRLLVKDHDAARRTDEEERKARQNKIEESARGRAFQDKLSGIKERFLGHFQNPDRQDSGYRLEEILYDLFVLFELKPKAPFRRIGEQIDGAFSLEGDHYLLEAKWQARQVNLNDLRDLDGAVASSLDNTLGLFISINGFTKEGLQGYLQGHRPRLFCFDGADLTLTLEGQIDLRELIQRKKDIAVQKRNIFCSATEILQGKA